MLNMIDYKNFRKPDEYKNINSSSVINMNMCPEELSDDDDDNYFFDRSDLIDYAIDTSISIFLFLGTILLVYTDGFNN